jgi:hypothetical protein
VWPDRLHPTTDQEVDEVGNELPEGQVLDEAESPEGSIELVAYQERGTIWIGVRSKGSLLKEAMGLHTGSGEHYVEATASIHQPWGVAFGAVSPEIERVEVRNEQGKAFEGRIVPLPESFDEEFQAAWGVATSCRHECNLFGYDDTGRLIDGSMLRPRRRDLTAEERLELIRAQCDNSMKYYTWALKRMPSIPEQATHVRGVENYRHEVAMWLAYVEGADDPRSALSAVDAIIQRYETAPDWQEWEPGNCSFCGERPVAAWFEGPTYKTFVRSSAEVRAEEAWLACGTCLALVEADDREGLAQRGTRRPEGRASEGAEAITREMQNEQFWRLRDQG